MWKRKYIQGIFTAGIRFKEIFSLSDLWIVHKSSLVFQIFSLNIFGPENKILLFIVQSDIIMLSIGNVTDIKNPTISGLVMILWTILLFCVEKGRCV